MLKVIISEVRNPNLFRMLNLLHDDVGVKLPAPGHIVIPGDCYPRLESLEEIAVLLSTKIPAPEDLDSMRAVTEGEATRYVDCEMTSFVLGSPELAQSIADRIPHGARLLSVVDRVREYLGTRERNVV